jgi:predicted nucleic acid-binding protein
LGYARQDPVVVKQLGVAAQANATVIIPAVALAEVLRGSPGDARINRLLRAAWVTFAGLKRAQIAAALLAKTGRDNTVDALIVAEAVGHRCILATGDPRDLGELVDAAGAAKHVVVVKV